MKRIAIDKAQKRLRSAQESLAEISQPQPFTAFEDRWYRLLVAGNAVDMILQTALKGPKEQPWFGKKIRLRRTDPLLSYMHAARNADEHGLEPVVVLQPSSVSIGRGGQAVHVDHLEVGASGITMSFFPVMGRLPTVTATPAHARLIDVVDIHKAVFSPPTHHLGSMIEDISPFGVAKLWLAYVGNVVHEAEQFIDV